ncbi:MAG: hypothetical protein JXA96_13615 [Sedimentisphaerales bacterium]|nr:hypothetical protein [Sedimentisphaerales bacterium]
MKKLLFIILVGLISLCSIEVAQAKQPFVYISFEQKAVKLSSSLIWDSVIPEALTLKVNSNCFHGSIVASMSSLKNKMGAEINQDRVFIKTLSTTGFVSLAKPVIVSEPAFGSHEIKIDFMVKANGEFDRAGKYSGAIAFTVLPPV